MSLDDTLSGIQSITTTIQTGVGTVTRAAADVGLVAIGGKSGSWRDRLQPASFRGIPFGVFGGISYFGRRNAIHEYPFRDKPFVEDLGRAARRIDMTGFLVENPVYGGVQSVIAQRERLIAAIEAGDNGELVHPTLGRLTVSNLKMATEERWDQGRVFELHFSFIESGSRIFPTDEQSTGDVVKLSCDAADFAAADDFASAAGVALKQGAAVVSQATSTAAKWGRQAQVLVNDATNLVHLAGSLTGNFGRFSNGKLVGGLGVLSAAAAGAKSISNLVAAASAARTKVSAAIADLYTKASGLGS